MSVRHVTLLDGGCGQEINKRSSSTESHPQWSVKVMHEEPEIVVQVHKEFIEAGAKVLTLNNYAATPSRMKRNGMSDLLQEAHSMAIDCANKAIDVAKVARHDINIAGCLPPLVASYATKEAPPYDQAYEEYCQLIEIQQSFVDFFLVETMSNMVELTAVLDALKHYEKKAYISLTIKDNNSVTLRSGQPLKDALHLLQERKAQAAMINCSHPEAIDLAMNQLKESTLPFGAYANGFKTIEPLKPGLTVDLLESREDITPERYADQVMGWVQQGTTIIGGCCEISPKHIAAIHERLRKEGITVRKMV